MEFVFYCWFVIGLVLAMTAILIALPSIVHLSVVSAAMAPRLFLGMGFGIRGCSRGSRCCAAMALIDIRDSARLTTTTPTDSQNSTSVE
jgi:hypothetical protein